MSIDPITVGWFLWIALFLILEGWALANKREGDTLSEHVYRWFSLRHQGKWVTARRAAFVMFLAWLVTHWLGGGWI